MLEYNFIRLIGYLGADPEVATTSDKKEFIKVNIATKDRARNEFCRFTSKPCWHLVYFHGDLAEYAKTLKKGMHIRVNGKLEYQSWTDRKRDVKRRFAFITAKKVITLSIARIKDGKTYYRWHNLK